MDKLTVAIAILTGYADAAEEFAAHASARADAAPEGIGRRVWEAEAAKEKAVARAYRTAIAEITGRVDATQALPTIAELMRDAGETLPFGTVLVRKGATIADLIRDAGETPA